MLQKVKEGILIKNKIQLSKSGPQTTHLPVRKGVKKKD